ncbi:hypothetical protein FZEAL_6314 [Fusarium zealandicum]|uniref:Uncharacterized protein n=1 Tax=Fusarium zealandicum TaxID=1053134 RepID=A0A8H4UI65_9HYPO|nr:hypothetical protein FZEAL_6314 [Fusarium zealandicum]
MDALDSKTLDQSLQDTLSKNMTSPLDRTNTLALDPADLSSGIFAYAILGLILAAFAGIIVVDMVRKHRTGELKDTGENLLSLGVLILKLPFLLFSPKNMSALWIWFSDLFRKEENKRRGKGKEGISLDRQFDSVAVIERLGGKSESSATDSNTPKTESGPELPVIAASDFVATPVRGLGAGSRNGVFSGSERDLEKGESSTADVVTKAE